MDSEIISKDKFEGKPEKFNPEVYCDVVEMMIESDETERALWMIENMPGWYRENPYPRAQDIKATLYKKLYTVKDYIQDIEEENEEIASYVRNSAFCHPRYDVVRSCIEQYNKQGKSPNIYEFGPASFWLPKKLKEDGVKFQYEAVTINEKALAKFQQDWPCEAPKQEEPNFFVCFEVIEHLWNEKDIVHFYHKCNIEADIVFLSTPHNVLCGGQDVHWSQRPLGHLRTYTVQEFVAFGHRSFPNRDWEVIPHQMMVLIGVKKQGAST